MANHALLKKVIVTESLTDAHINNCNNKQIGLPSNLLYTSSNLNAA